MDVASRAILQAGWRAFFDGMADALVGKRAEVEAASLDLGDQILAEVGPLLGVTYDAQDDARCGSEWIESPHKAPERDLCSERPEGRR